MSLTPEEILHDRATRGEVLSPAEQVQLDGWYAELNRQETLALFGQSEPPPSLMAMQQSLALLRIQVDESLAQLAVTTQQLQDVSAQNRSLRAEIATLRIQVAQQGLQEAA